MSEQNFRNHSKYVPSHHFVVPTLLIAFMTGSVINLFDCIHKNDGLYSASLICLLGPLLVIIWWNSRAFAFRAQDRAIRAEENLRHFVATGKPLDSRLRMRQIIALRFAGDAEFVALAKRAADEKMPAKEIKSTIQHWKADNNRV